MNKTGMANQLWFLDSLVTIRVSTSEGPDGFSVLEHRMPCGSSPPLHLHHTEDELFHILEGEYRLRVQDQERRVGPGASSSRQGACRTPTGWNPPREVAA